MEERGGRFECMCIEKLRISIGIGRSLRTGMKFTSFLNYSRGCNKGSVDVFSVYSEV